MRVVLLASGPLARDRNSSAAPHEALRGKERQRNQGTEASENHTESEERSERVAGAIRSFFKFRVKGEENERRDRRRGAERDRMRDKIPPGDMVRAMRTTVAQAKSVEPAKRGTPADLPPWGQYMRLARACLPNSATSLHKGR